MVKKPFVPGTRFGEKRPPPATTIIVELLEFPPGTTWAPGVPNPVATCRGRTLEVRGFG